MKRKILNRENYKFAFLIFVFSVFVSLMFCFYNAHAENTISDNGNVVNKQESNVTITATSSVSNFSVLYTPIAPSFMTDVVDLSSDSTNSFSDTNVSSGIIVINFDVEENWFAIQDGTLMYAISDDIDMFDSAICYFTPLKQIAGKIPVWYVNGKRVGEKWTAFNDGVNAFELVYESTTTICDLSISSHAISPSSTHPLPTFSLKTTIGGVEQPIVKNLTEFSDTMFSSRLFNYSADYFYNMENIFYYGYTNSENKHVRSVLQFEKSEFWDFVGWTVNGEFIPNQAGNLFADNYLFYNYLNKGDNKIQIAPVFAPTNTFGGCVVDAKSGLAISNAQVIVKLKNSESPIKTKTDNFGCFSVNIEQDVPFELYIIEQSHLTIHANFESGITAKTAWQQISMDPVNTSSVVVFPSISDGLDCFQYQYSVDEYIIDSGYVNDFSSLVKVGSTFNNDAQGNLVFTWNNQNLKSKSEILPSAKNEKLTILVSPKAGYSFEKWLLNGQDFESGVVDGKTSLNFSASLVANEVPVEDVTGQAYPVVSTGDNFVNAYIAIIAFMLAVVFWALSRKKACIVKKH